MKHNTIYKLYPQVVTIHDSEGAFDKDGNLVEIDNDLVEAKAIEFEAAEVAAQQAAEAAKTSALSKLAKLGLTDAEIKALTGN